MKKVLFPVVAALAFVAFKPVNTDPLPIGASMPKADLKLQDISGKEITLAGSKKSQGLLVIFSCNTCPYVIKNQSRNNEIAAYAESKQIGVVIVNSNEAQRDGADSPEAMKKYAAEQRYKWNYTIDKNSELADAFGATKTPECFLFDKAGVLVYHGAIDDNPTDAQAVTRYHLKEAINEVTAGQDVSVKTSRSIGCTIKRLK